MSDLALTAGFALTKGDSSSKDDFLAALSLTGSKFAKTRITITTSNAQVSLGSVGTPKVIVFKNVGANLAKYGDTTGVMSGQIVAGGVAIYTPISGALWMQSTVGSTDLLMFVCDA